MTSTPARKRESSSSIAAPRQTRSQLGLVKMLQAGRELIEASGNLDNLSINDIVDRAGTSIGAFYRRFDNKDAFFEVVQGQVMAEGLAYVRDMLEREPVWRSNDAGALADATVAFYVMVFRRNRGLYHASLLRSSQLKPSWDAAKEANREAGQQHPERPRAALAREPAAAPLSAEGVSPLSQAARRLIFLP